MNNLEQVEAIRQQLIAEGAPKPETIRQIALACIGWPYVFGAWGEECNPTNRKRRARDAHPTIKSKCQCLRDKDRKDTCDGCQWYPDQYRVRMYDCRGFTRWLLQQVGLDIVNSAGKACQTVTNQYNAANNWLRRGTIAEMPDCVCCVFDLKHGHTGMHIGGGVVVDCSVNVRSVGMSGWTHYAIPVGLYTEEEIPVEIVRKTLRKGDSGEDVRDLQETLTELGYGCGDIDGKFGTKTKNAVVAFQTDAGLDPDGVVGRKTWAALDKAEAQLPPAPDTPVTYTVKCFGMSWSQVQEIREICPMAEVSKE